MVDSLIVMMDWELKLFCLRFLIKEGDTNIRFEEGEEAFANPPHSSIFQLH
jgi:hypothetical protein